MSHISKTTYPHVPLPPAVSFFTSQEEVLKFELFKTKTKTLSTIFPLSNFFSYISLSLVAKYGRLGTCSGGSDTVRASDSGTSLSDSGERSNRGVREYAHQRRLDSRPHHHFLRSHHHLHHRHSSPHLYRLILPYRIYSLFRLSGLSLSSSYRFVLKLQLVFGFVFNSLSVCGVNISGYVILNLNMRLS